MGSLSFFAMSRLKSASTNRASFQSVPSNERANGNFFTIARCIDYSDYPYFDSPNETGYYSLAHIGRYLHQNLQI